MKNKKGFTLVELLAVIVILALIMSIAVVSISGVLTSSRQNTFKETAASIIGGVRQQLILNNKLDEGYYTFSSAILEKGATTSPMGGDYQYADLSSCTDKIGTTICKVTTGTTCSTATDSFVHVAKSGSAYTYSICLKAGSGNKYISDTAVISGDSTTAGTETNLLNSSYNGMITQ